MKRYSTYYTSDEIVCNSNDHFYGNASSLKTAISYISRIKKTYSAYNPRNFRIIDNYADVDYNVELPIIYQEN